MFLYMLTGLSLGSTRYRECSYTLKWVIWGVLIRSRTCWRENIHPENFLGPPQQKPECMAGWIESWMFWHWLHVCVYIENWIYELSEDGLLLCQVVSTRSNNPQHKEFTWTKIVGEASCAHSPSKRTPFFTHVPFWLPKCPFDKIKQGRSRHCRQLQARLWKLCGKNASIGSSSIGR